MDSLDKELERQEHEATATLEKIRSLQKERHPDQTNPSVELRTFLAQPDAEIPWILGGVLVTGSLNVLAAGGGVGKTTLLAQIALSLGAGRDVLGFKVYRQHTVLTIQAEGAREAFRQRLKRTARSLRIEEPDSRGFIQPENFADFIIRDGGIKRLVKETRPDLVILDTVGFFHRASENDAAEWKAHVVNPLKDITREFGTAWALVLHNRKEDPKFPQAKAYRPRGTTAIHDDADLLLALDKKLEADGKDIGNRTLSIVKNRYGASDTEIPLYLDAQNAVYTEGWRVAPLNQGKVFSNP